MTVVCIHHSCDHCTDRIGMSEGKDSAGCARIRAQMRNDTSCTASLLVEFSGQRVEGTLAFVIGISDV